MIKIFCLEDQNAFARLSGDHNPIHIDPIAARRLLFGEPVVHGLHLVLWALEGIVKPGNTSGLRRVKASFAKPVALGVPVEAIWSANKAKVSVAGVTVAQIEVDFTPDSFAGPIIDDTEPTEKKTQQPDVSKIQNLFGETALSWSRSISKQLLPLASEYLEVWQLATLVATTRIIGMRCPGENSLFSGLNLTFKETYQTQVPKIAYKTSNYDARFNQVVLSIVGPGVEGDLTAFFRPVPIVQAKVSEFLEVIPKNAFEGKTALIIGGSRGIGEVAAKLFAAGGGDVCLTYQSGKNDAETIRDDLQTQVGRAYCLEWDVTNPTTFPKSWPEELKPITHLFYCAAPRIMASSPEDFDYALFMQYVRVFVEGFERTIRVCKNWSDGELMVFYPSSVYVTEGAPKFKEYAAAKAAGESIGQTLARQMKGLHIESPRLPRMRTEQTTGLIPENLANPVDIMKNEMQVFQNEKTSFT